MTGTGLIKMRLLLWMTFLFAPTAGTTQNTKKPLDDQAYSEWKKLEMNELSYQGNWIAYSIASVDQEVEAPELDFICLINPQTGDSIRLDHAKNCQFFDSGNWVRYTVPGADAKSDSTIIQSLSSRKKKCWEKPYYTQYFENSSYLMYSYTVEERELNRFKRLVFYNVNTKDSIYIDHVINYQLYDHNKAILYTCNVDNRLELLAGKIDGRKTQIYQCGKDAFGRFQVNANGTGGTFTISSDEKHSQDELFSFNLNNKKTQRLLNFNDISIPDTNYKVVHLPYDLTIDAKSFIPQVQLKHSGSHSKISKNEVKLELWKWNEGTTERRMNRRAKPMQPQPPVFVYQIEEKKCIQLTQQNEELVIAPSALGIDYVFVSNPTHYRVSQDWELAQRLDIYQVNAHTGERKEILTGTVNTPIWSPSGKFAIYYNEKKKAWFEVAPNRQTDSCSFVNLSAAIGHPVYDESHDYPSMPDAYGLAGWSKQNEQLIIYDRYDLWVIDPKGKKDPYSLTGEWGRKHKTSLRLQGAVFQVQLDIHKPILLTGFNEQTKAHGLYCLNEGKLTSLVEGDFNINNIKFSANAQACIYTKERFDMSPDLWWSDDDFTETKQITRLNQQQYNYNWGTAKLIQWKNFDGSDNEGILYLPENYDPKCEYPVIVNFYEQSSQTLYNYLTPGFSESSINIPTYVSNDYIIFRPDIKFHVGAPGQSSFNSVVSGTRELIRQGIAHKGHIGIMGHSYGGFQVSYLVTQTNLFTCAVPASGVTNMISNYTSLRGNGFSCMFMYEVGQHRMGAGFFDRQQAYIDNSAIFQANKIETPMLIFHCDADHTVPFQEGLALFMAMRRQQKPAWLCNYKGEGHDLAARTAQVDWTHRMMDFFDYYLKNKHIPEWMQ